MMYPTHAATGHVGRCAVAVMSKQSVPGRTKTRLIPHIGPDLAAALNTAFLKDVAENLVAASEFVSIDPFMAYSPAGSEAFFRSILPDRVGLIESVKPDLGACLLHATETLLSSGYGAVCLLNADSPTLPTAYVIAAATALAADGDRLVLGPAIDGGYYLIGATRAHKRLFEDIAWSTDRVFEQTIDRAREIDLPVVVLPTWYDVDELPTLRLLIGEVLYGRRFRDVGGRACGGSHARALLSGLAETATWHDVLHDRDPPRAEVA